MRRSAVPHKRWSDHFLLAEFLQLLRANPKELRIYPSIVESQSHRAAPYFSGRARILRRDTDTLHLARLPVFPFDMHVTRPVLRVGRYVLAAHHGGACHL